MKRIYTRTGDKGTTGIHGGTRVPKDDIRIEANGCLDELNCQIGVVRSLLRCRVKPGMTGGGKDGMTEGGSAGGPGGEATVLSGQTPPAARNGSGFATERCPVKPGMTGEFDEILHEIQRNLMTVMSLVATPAAERKNNPNTLPDNLVVTCEATMDSLTGQSGPSLHFLLPGGTPLAAQLQLARAVCRRAERRLWTLHHQDPVPEEILQYINRLSDLLFVMARQELARQDWPEERWKAFSYKNQR